MNAENADEIMVFTIASTEERCQPIVAKLQKMQVGDFPGGTFGGASLVPVNWMSWEQFMYPPKRPEEQKPSDSPTLLEQLTKFNQIQGPKALIVEWRPHNKILWKLRLRELEASLASSLSEKDFVRVAVPTDILEDNGAEGFSQSALNEVADAGFSTRLPPQFSISSGDRESNADGRSQVATDLVTQLGLLLTDLKTSRTTSRLQDEPTPLLDSLARSFNSDAIAPPVATKTDLDSLRWGAYLLALCLSRAYGGLSKSDYTRLLSDHALAEVVGGPWHIEPPWHAERYATSQDEDLLIMATLALLAGSDAARLKETTVHESGTQMTFWTKKDIRQRTTLEKVTSKLQEWVIPQGEVRLLGNIHLRATTGTEYHWTITRAIETETSKALPGNSAWKP